VRRGPEALLVRRHDPALAGAHGKWELPGGKLDFGEAPAAAVAREVLEETGYAIAEPTLLPYVYSMVWEYPDRRQHVILLVFDCPAGPRLREPTDPKVAEIAWRRPEEIDFAAALPNVRDFVEWWRARDRP
jgi:8-oxo-dGTP pyrophosphatase MutT (NUDIX family)